MFELQRGVKRIEDVDLSENLGQNESGNDSLGYFTTECCELGTHSFVTTCSVNDFGGKRCRRYNASIKM